MQVFKLPVDIFVFLLLPLGAGGIAEKNPTTKGTDGMDSAKPADLERAAGTLPNWQ